MAAYVSLLFGSFPRHVTNKLAQHVMQSFEVQSCCSVL